MRAVSRSLLVALVATSAVAQAQPTQQASNQKGRIITSADIKAWNAIRSATLANDGKWFAYVIAPNEGDATLVLKRTTDASKEMKFSVGGTGGGTFTISGDSKWIGFIVAQPRPLTGAGVGGRGGRGGRGANAQRNPMGPRNKFVLVNIATGDKKEFDRVRNFEFSGESPIWIALQGYRANDTTSGAAIAGGRGAAGGGGTHGQEDTPVGDLNLYRISNGEMVNIGNVGEFAFDDDGSFLAWTAETPDMVGNGVQIRNLKTDVSRSYDSERALYRRLVWVDSIDAVGVLRGEVDICRSSGIPSEYVAIDYLTSRDCPALQDRPLNAMLVEGISFRPVGTVMRICLGQRQPADWDPTYDPVAETSQCPRDGTDVSTSPTVMEIVRRRGA
jgi:hypothetical protein